jgi:hypothetical protein
MRKWNGMNWITQKKRLAIYLRDGLHCVYCGASVENGAHLTLDHIRPVSIYGVDNSAKNLITCCDNCNTRRGKRHMTIWAAIVAQFNNIQPEQIHSDIRRLRSRSLRKYLKLSAAMISDRGSVSKALAAANNNGELDQ